MYDVILSWCVSMWRCIMLIMDVDVLMLIMYIALNVITPICFNEGKHFFIMSTSCTSWFSSLLLNSHLWSRVRRRREHRSRGKAAKKELRSALHYILWPSRSSAWKYHCLYQNSTSGHMVKVHIQKNQRVLNSPFCSFGSLFLTLYHLNVFVCNLFHMSTGWWIIGKW